MSTQADLLARTARSPARRARAAGAPARRPAARRRGAAAPAPCSTAWRPAAGCASRAPGRPSGPAAAGAAAAAPPPAPAPARGAEAVRGRARPARWPEAALYSQAARLPCTASEETSATAAVPGTKRRGAHRRDRVVSADGHCQVERHGDDCVAGRKVSRGQRAPQPGSVYRPHVHFCLCAGVCGQDSSAAVCIKQGAN